MPNTKRASNSPSLRLTDFKVNHINDLKVSDKSTDLQKAPNQILKCYQFQVHGV